MLWGIAKRVPLFHPFFYRPLLLLGKRSLLWVCPSCCLGLAVVAVVEGVSVKPIMCCNMLYFGLMIRVSFKPLIALATLSSWSSWRVVVVVGD